MMTSKFVLKLVHIKYIYVCMSIPAYMSIYIDKYVYIYEYTIDCIDLLIYVEYIE